MLWRTDRQLASARDELSVCRDDSDALQRSVSHDLRSPIGAVLNFATVLELDHGEDLGPDGRQVVQRIRRSAESGLVLLDALSRLSRVARAPLRRAPVDVETLIRQAFTELGDPAARSELTLGAIPPALADADLLRTAFRELLANAVKFTAAGTVTLEATVADDRVSLCVSDTGPGIAREHLERVFDMFWQVDQRITRKAGGTGLGLSVARQLARLLGGDVSVRSMMGEGSVFTVDLPLAAPSST